MKYLLSFLLIMWIGVDAQEYGKNIGSISVAFDNKNPKEYKHTDTDLTIAIQDVGMGYVYFNVRNNSDKAVSFQWPTSHYVITEETIPFKDASGATAQMLGLEIKEANSVSQPTLIAPESKVVLKCATKSAVLFDYRKANKYFQENGKLPNDRAVLQFEINGEKVDKVIPIQVYTSKIKKALKK